MKNTRILVIALAALLLCGAGAYAWHAHSTKVTTKSTASKTNAALNTQNEQRKLGAQGSTLSNSSTDSKDGQTSASQGTSSNAAANFTVHITSVNVNNGNVHIGDLVSGTSTGDCVLTFSRSGYANIVQTASVKQDVNSYDCGAFNTNTAKFPTSGTWQAELKVTSQGSSTTDTAQVNI